MLHERTLDSLGIDPLDPMGKTPVDFPISLATYGSYWAYVGKMASGILSEMQRSAFHYSVFSGNAPDVFGSYIGFGFKSYFLWFFAYGDVVVEYQISDADKIIYANTRQHITYLQSDAFRVRNLVSGSNVQYQLVAYF